MTSKGFPQAGHSLIFLALRVARSLCTVSSASKIYWNIHSSKIGIYNSLNTYYNGQISDVRIYATALSDSDILELYQSSASVDNNGNLMLAGEVIEE